jgi:hypothetical protein
MATDNPPALVGWRARREIVVKQGGTESLDA